MGTDIHLFTETRERDGSRLARVEIECTWCNGKKKYEDGRECFNCSGTGHALGYSDRNYDVFAMLADVRNGTGFAGVVTGDGFNVIAPQRGVPKDLDPKLKKHLATDGNAYDEFDREYGAGSLGDHSFSWLTLREILDFDWSQVSRSRGIVSLAEYRSWRKTINRHPASWSGGVWGNGVVIMSEGDARVMAPSTDLEYSYVECFWCETYAESAGAFYSKFVPALVALGRDPKDVRIVFGFDS